MFTSADVKFTSKDVTFRSADVTFSFRSLLNVERNQRQSVRTAYASSNLDGNTTCASLPFGSEDPSLCSGQALPSQQARRQRSVRDAGFADDGVNRLHLQD